MTIDDWRRKIDEIDQKLVELLNERSRWVQEIGRAKRAVGLPVYQPEREQEILRKVEEGNPGPLPNGALRRLFERILDEARSVERHVMSDAAETGQDPEGENKK
jgi:chorismate mutase